MLKDGRVAVLVVAGGQATRLGFAGPKGLFPIGPVTDRTLFELQAQKLRRVGKRCGRPVPWYVMTSPETDGPTRAFFDENENLGLAPDDLFFFVQGTVPCFDFKGRLILAERGRLAENPNGHGGVVTALDQSGALDDMERRGITTLFYYQVDNPLVRIADPVFLGFHAQGDAEISCKVVRKTDPNEKVGVLARRGGTLSVVEYTELDAEHRDARDADGGLRFWAGNVAIHLFEVAFLRHLAREAETHLPFHASKKKIPGLDASGHRVEPEAPNGLKLERFVFDAVPAAQRVCVVEADRAEDLHFHIIIEIPIPERDRDHRDEDEAKRDDPRVAERAVVDAVLRPPVVADAGEAAVVPLVGHDVEPARLAEDRDERRVRRLRGLDDRADVGDLQVEDEEEDGREVHEARQELLGEKHHFDAPLESLVARDEGHALRDESGRHARHDADDDEEQGGREPSGAWGGGGRRRSDRNED